MATSPSNGLPIRVKDIIGTKFSRWTVISYAGKNKHRQSLWICRCSCPKALEKIVSIGSLQNGKSTSCGCRREEYTAQLTTHGHSKLPEYYIWRGLKVRGTNLNGKDAKNYVLRGIVVCERWLNSFPNFLADMGRRPSPKHTLERLDNDGPYSPENCAWVLMTRQARNKRTTRFLTYKGEKLCMADWSDRMGWGRGKLKNRIYAGWSDERALSTP